MLEICMCCIRNLAKLIKNIQGFSRHALHGDMETELGASLDGLEDGLGTAKVDFAVFGASKSAQAAVEKAGGSIKILAPKREEGEKAA